MLYARDVHRLDDHEAILNDPSRLAAMRADIEAGDAYIVRNVLSRERLAPIREYLERVGRSSLPNYRPIEAGCPNFHRLNRWDPRAHVQGCFHQFVFFPWNEDVFDLFGTFRPIYQLKNALSGLPRERFLGREPEAGCTARLAFQFYPRGLGGLNKHADPVDRHQLTVPTMLLSKKGEDFQSGGAYVERETGERIYLDDGSDWGDVVYFNARVCHGVERVDPDADVDWLSFRGRWILLFAVNKLHDNTAVPDSVDLESGAAGRETVRT